MSHSIADRCLALAGVFQAAALVHELASKGQIPAAEISTAVQSLLKIDAASTAEVFGGVSNVRSGLEAVRDRLTGKVPAEEMPITRYTVGLLHLERKLIKQPDTLDELRRGIEQAQQQAEYFSPEHENVIAALADLYQRTISTLGPRIMVQGEPEVLSAPHNQNLIRMLLLFGIRSAVLWDQSGGSRWQFLFKRRALIEAAESLLSTL